MPARFVPQNNIFRKTHKHPVSRLRAAGHCKIAQKLVRIVPSTRIVFNWRSCPYRSSHDGCTIRWQVEEPYSLRLRPPSRKHTPTPSLQRCRPDTPLFRGARRQLLPRLLVRSLLTLRPSTPRPIAPLISPRPRLLSAGERPPKMRRWQTVP